MRFLLLFVLLAGGCRLSVPPGAAEGREGNAHFRGEDFPAAADRYRDGLARAEEAGETVGSVPSALHNNLGAALFEDHQMAEAEAAFAQAVAAAPSPVERARAAYNRGTAAAAGGQLQAALDAYRQALLERPDYTEARYNFEFVLRQLQEDAPQDTPPPPTPSPFAQELRARAEALVAERRYAEALDLLEEGARTDSTVLAYEDFIGRIGTVVAIENTAGQEE